MDDAAGLQGLAGNAHSLDSRRIVKLSPADACFSHPNRGKLETRMAQFSPEGTFTALVTPFKGADAAIDWEAYERLLDTQLQAKVGLVPCGTTGESATLSEGEQFEVIRRAVQFSRGRLPVLAGVGSNSTHKALELARAAAEAGADALLLVMPYYNKPSQAGLALHVESVLRAVDRPFVLYNVPHRTVVSLEVDTLLGLLDKLPNLVGLKDASGHVLYCQKLLAKAGERIGVLCGDDGLTLPMMSVGARGVISVASNVLPKAVAAVVRAVNAGQFAEAKQRHLALLDVYDALFSAPSPAPTKAALASRGLLADVLRPPMVGLDAAERQRVLKALAAFESAWRP
jgi:4-hydroxy-tetrahydrodipicolinate synthase